MPDVKIDAITPRRAAVSTDIIPVSTEDGSANAGVSVGSIAALAATATASITTLKLGTILAQQ